MKKHPKALSPEQAVKKLKAAANKWQAPIYAKDAKRPTYRTVAGPYKVSFNEFRSKQFFFNPERLDATSYDWWYMLTVHKGKLVRNTCGYSPQTSVHQSMLDAAMKALGIKADLEVNTRANIRSIDDLKADYLRDWAEAVVRHKYSRNSKGKGYWEKNRSRAMRKIEKAGIGIRFTKKDKAVALKKAEARRRSRLDWQKEKRQRAKEREAERAAEVQTQAPAPRGSDHAARVERIKGSLEKINSLMQEMRQGKSPKSTVVQTKPSRVIMARPSYLTLVREV